MLPVLLKEYIMTKQQNDQMNDAAILGIFISLAIGLISSIWLPGAACLGIGILVWFVHMIFMTWIIFKEEK